MLPAGLRQRDQTQKSPTGPLDREALLQHLEKQALEAEERDDLVPFTGEKKGAGTRGGPGGGRWRGPGWDRAPQRWVYLARQNGPRQRLGCPGRAGSPPAPGMATPWQCHPPHGHPLQCDPQRSHPWHGHRVAMPPPGNVTPPRRSHNPPNHHPGAPSVTPGPGHPPAASLSPPRATAAGQGASRVPTQGSPSCPRTRRGSCRGRSRSRWSPSWRRPWPTPPRPRCATSPVGPARGRASTPLRVPLPPHAGGTCHPRGGIAAHGRRVAHPPGPRVTPGVCQVPPCPPPGPSAMPPRSAFTLAPGTPPPHGFPGRGRRGCGHPEGT